LKWGCELKSTPFSSSKDALFMLLTSVYGKAQGEPYYKPKHTHIVRGLRCMLSLGAQETLHLPFESKKNLTPIAF
jgi:hypothetical protein